MVNSDKKPIDYDHPVAYAVDGRPLYASPADDTQLSAPKSIEVVNEIREKHEKSKKLFPGVDLCDDEYVISSIKRHPVGLIGPFTLGVILIALTFIALFNLDALIPMVASTNKNISLVSATLPVILVILLVVIATYTTYFIYYNNRFFLTNKSVYQIIQTGLFSKHEQTISLRNIEDASYTQTGIFQQLLNYGSIRLSTIGDEHTYTLTYVESPKDQISMLNRAVKSFKN